MFIQVCSLLITWWISLPPAPRSTYLRGLHGPKGTKKPQHLTDRGGACWTGLVSVCVQHTLSARPTSCTWAPGVGQGHLTGQVHALPSHVAPGSQSWAVLPAAVPGQPIIVGNGPQIPSLVPGADHKGPLLGFPACFLLPGFGFPALPSALVKVSLHSSLNR